MHTIQLNTKEAPNKWWAFKDASMRSTINSSLYTQAERIVAERMKLALELVYTGRVYIAYGKTGISIKLDQPRVRDRKELKILEKIWEANGVKKRETSQGTIYRLTRV